MEQEQSWGDSRPPNQNEEISATSGASTDRREITELREVNAQLRKEVEELRSQSQLSLKPQKPKVSKLRLGLWLVLLSTFALSIHNVIVRITIGQPIRLFGLFSAGGFIQPTIGNSLLILWMRMLVVVPLMIGIAGFLYPPVWQDLQKVLLKRDRRPLWHIIGSGVFLFLSQVLIYIAIAQIGPGAAVTILFMYPLLTVPLAWWLFNDRPTRLRVVVMGLILLGVILTAIPSLMVAKLGGGVFFAIFSGAAFALYLILMQLGFRKVHPVPVSVVQFLTVLVCTSVSLSLPLQLGVAVSATGRPGLFIGGLVLGAFTLVGYLSNNFGVRYMGAAQASIIASSGPVLTALLAAVIIRTKLDWVQIAGILLVTIGVTALSFERMRKTAKSA
ncbi:MULTISPECIES: EamA family transporter [Leptolyngbya]|uniref:EamA family transporter n=1 Tax=Leptolyngbya boryana CZ1 TaxID=3060204 RepID=A0AA96WXE3_LEPBY|nr:MULTISPECIES: EamA family transporter [Leptolyngbya]MCY6491264.1 EamA family transporter [Leptolyngbya sp. GGD]WNZ45959.1 EamA family transporter [Leptolyngbya boryana CZ1]